MAPQNSTLLHEEENFELTSEISRYSPILPLKTVGGGTDYSNDDADGGISSSSTGYDVGAGIVHDKKSIYTAATINIEQVRFKFQELF